ncbi:histidinol dehydrogenase [Ornithinibacillus scapharcae]|uniref:histidinol dehydrogenase n=1 Tax=Ornithinibacillus scapharcae TaxID=1147159 RepID=UPI000225BF3D|nr:histidinol dehydrogenase [Ornithinibacillus scapharcae]
MKIVTAKKFNKDSLFRNASTFNEKIDRAVQNIINEIRLKGDSGLRSYTEKFDGPLLDNFIVTNEEIEKAKKLVDDTFLTTILQAKENIEAFHENQKEQSWHINPANGIILGQKITPIEKVGIYVPGGKANYPSTVLMNVIPAKVAGVPYISIATPPREDGSINPYVLTTATLLGVNRIYKMGGAQAIAALAYGTETIERVYKIVGPGNSYVASAKKSVYGDVAIDMIAGPSEICIIADNSTNPKFIAADLLSQAEHDEAARTTVITTSPSLANQITEEIKEQLSHLSRREIAQESIRKNGFIILATSEEEAFEIANLIAPEHLQLMVTNSFEKLEFVKNAGAIFLGDYSPEPLGDYFAGPNHTLPTNGTAKFSSPLGVYDFIKKSSIIHYSKQALGQASDAIQYLAVREGLEAHAKSVQIRRGD